MTYLADYDVMSLLVLKLKRLKGVVECSKKEQLSRRGKVLVDIDKEIQVLFSSCPSGIFSKEGSLRLLSLKQQKDNILAHEVLS